MDRRAVRDEPRLELMFIMVIHPVLLNVVFFYLIDNLIMFQKVHRPKTSASTQNVELSDA